MRRVVVTLVTAAVLVIAPTAAALSPGLGSPDPSEFLAQEDSTTVTAPATDVPATTAAPDAEDNDADWWVLLIVLGGLVILGVAIARGGRKKNVYVAPVSPGWKPKARDGYADARWLYDSMTEDLAIWRGNAQFDGTTESGSTAETAQADTWNALAPKMDRARDALYGLEGAAPDKRTAQTAEAVVVALAAARTALDARAETRYNYRTVEASGDDAELRPKALAEARDRELRTAQTLAESRRTLAETITALSTLT